MARGGRKGRPRVLITTTVASAPSPEPQEAEQSIDSNNSRVSTGSPQQQNCQKELYPKFESGLLTQQWLTLTKEWRAKIAQGTAHDQQKQIKEHIQQDEEGFQPVLRHTARPQGINNGSVSNIPTATLIINSFNALQEDGGLQHGRRMGAHDACG
ncbi:LOW QUALITY PROTEIN: hypothetical protein Cgig2_020706 [Carnegiea gigantea]|uniref:Uncharacterized protein n=1 Tax=Carnegiea gigantea TaxID=171969 RepID=A0A9Q1JKM4_9CARY|nr:LOW QUALITY PROTEIN: hypothetical protein Cgig2_020706 [Carnegiea gigantea]